MYVLEKLVGDQWVRVGEKVYSERGAKIASTRLAHKTGDQYRPNLNPDAPAPEPVVAVVSE